MKLGQNVKLVLTEERGTVIGTAKYLEDPNRYLVRYKAADGRQVEGWFSSQAIVASEE